MSKSRSFDAIPPHILADVAGHIFRDCSEIQTWNLRRVCRAFREAADFALKPSLGTVEVIALPNLSGHLSDEMPDEYAEEDQERKVALREINKKFTKHLKVYRSKRAVIKRLTVEVRDDDPKLGWSLLKNHASTLEEAEIHIWDQRWSKYVNGGETRGGGSDDVRARWARNLQKGEIQFPNLTSLTLLTTARISEHLAGALKSVPNLRELTLVCHWWSSDLMYDNLADLPPRLERLTLRGELSSAADILLKVLPFAPSIRHLVLDLSELPEEGRLDEMVISRIAVHRPLESLAFYGVAAAECMRGLRRVQNVIGATLPNLSTLVVDDWSGSAMGGDKTPLLEDKQQNRPALPALRSITFTDKFDHSRYERSSTPGAGRSYHWVYERAAVCELALQYPTLGTMRWTAGYPEDPFDLNSPIEYDGEEKFRLDWEPGTVPPSSGAEIPPDDPNAWWNRTV